MNLTIVHFVGKNETGREPFSGSILDAREHGKAAVDSGVAQRIEVQDQNGSALAHWPRFLKAGRNA